MRDEQAIFAVELLLEKIQHHRSKATVKILTFLLSFSKIVSYYTQLQIMVSSIGIVAFAILIYGLMIDLKSSELTSRVYKLIVDQRRFYFWFFFLLALNLPYTYLWTSAVWLKHLLKQNFQYFGKFRESNYYKNEPLMVLLILEHIMFLLQLFILLRVEGIILWWWGLLALPFVLLAVFAGFFISVAAWSFYIDNSTFAFAVMDDYDDDEEQVQMRQGKVNIIFIGNIFLVSVTLVIEHYSPSTVYQFLLLFTFVTSFIETVAYCCYKREIIHLYEAHFFSNNVVERTHINIFLPRSEKPRQIEYRTWQFDFPKCFICGEQEAELGHSRCGRLLYCKYCFRKRKLKASNGRICQTCPICRKPNYTPFLHVVNPSLYFNDELTNYLYLYLQPYEYFIKR